MSLNAIVGRICGSGWSLRSPSWVAVFLSGWMLSGWVLAGSPDRAVAQFRVETTVPSQGEADVDRHKGIAIFFSQPPDRTTIPEDAIVVHGSVSGRVLGSVTFPDSLIALFSPWAPFADGEVVTVGLHPGILSTEGDSIQTEFELQFSTASASDIRSQSPSNAPVQVQAPRYFFSTDEDPEMAYEVLLGKAEDLIAGRFGVDTMEVSSYKVGSRSATAIRTGWVLNARTQFAIVNEVRGSTPRTRFLLEYRLSERLQLVLTQGGERGEGVDLVWSREY
jgi:hypothetical protein